MHPEPAIAMDLRHLAYGEHLLVWSFRAFAVGRYDCPMVVREYSDACGNLAREARAAVQVFAQQTQMQGRRQVRLGHPGCLSLTRDEQLLLAIFTAAQKGEKDRCDAHLAWLLARPACAPFYAAASVAVQALALQGHRLGDVQPPPRGELGWAPEPLRIPRARDTGNRMRPRAPIAEHLNSFAP